MSYKAPAHSTSKRVKVWHFTRGAGEERGVRRKVLMWGSVLWLSCGNQNAGAVFLLLTVGSERQLTPKENRRRGRRNAAVQSLHSCPARLNPFPSPVHFAKAFQRLPVQRDLDDTNKDLQFRRKAETQQLTFWGCDIITLSHSSCSAAIKTTSFHRSRGSSSSTGLMLHPGRAHMASHVGTGIFARTLLKMIKQPYLPKCTMACGLAGPTGVSRSDRRQNGPATRIIICPALRSVCSRSSQSAGVDRLDS
jgi:hypothetical protein